VAVSRDPEFRTVRMREGYDLDAVDDFVDRVIDALDGRGSPNSLNPEQIENEEFKVVRMREGYSMDDVDDWLDSAAAELRKLRKAAQGQTSSHQMPPQQPAAAHAPQMGHTQQAYAPPAPQPVAPPPMNQPMPGAAPPGAQPAPSAHPGAHHPPAGHGYYDTTHGGTPTQGFDPLTDTAINELDPALRALESNAGRAAPPEPAPAPAPPVHQPPQPAAYEAPQPDGSLGGVAATPDTGLHHVEIWARDLDHATRSFGWIFERLGWTLFQVWENGRSWQSPGGGPYVVVERSPDIKWSPYDRTNPGLNHLALAVPERWMVDQIVSEAPTYGWRLMFADRHPFAGGDHHYAAYMENEEGFEVEVVAP